MKRFSNMVAVAGLVLVTTVAAHAQAAGLLGSGDIKVGVFGPSSSTGRDNAGNSQIAVGVDYTPPGIPGVQRPTFYADYQGGSKNSGHVNTLGIGVAEKFSPPLVGSITKVSPYAGVGLGLYHTDVKNFSAATSGTGTSLGGKLFAGLNFGKWLVEANYQWIPSVKSVDPKGYGLQVGMSF